jgi:hypothetical protein
MTLLFAHPLRRCHLLSLTLLALAGASTPVTAQLSFSEVGASRGIQPYTGPTGFGGGVAAADFDNDGDVDIFVANESGSADQLYRNQGDGHFDEIAASVGLASMVRSRNALWVDIDNDDDLDLLVNSDCWSSTCIAGTSLVRLYRQEVGGTFTDITTVAGLFDDAALHGTGEHRSGLSAGDLDGDGYLDLYIGTWMGTSMLFHNQGDGTFADISTPSGLGVNGAGHFQSVWHDFDGDGLLDIFVSVDGSSNQLWVNQGDLTFIDMAGSAGVDSSWAEMAAAVSGYDNDGDFEVYATNIFSGGRYSTLYRNASAAGSITFGEVAQAAGVADGQFGWGATFFDADNDGWPDLAATNGFSSAPWTADVSRFFLNDGGVTPTFSEIGATVGFNDTFWGTALVAFDADRDGDVELFQATNPGPLRFLENQLDPSGGTENSLIVQPRMEMNGGNRRAIGAVLRAQAGSLEMARLITAGTNFLGQEPAEAHFGLADQKVIEQLTVQWPDGNSTTLQDIPAGGVFLFSDSIITYLGFESGDLTLPTME